LVADWYNLNKLLGHETRKEHQIDVNRFSDLEGLDISIEDDTWVKIRYIIKASAKDNVGVFETRTNKPYFDRERSELANKKKQAKLIWLRNPNDQTSEDFSNVRRNTCRTFKKRSVIT
jgi:hypothetical protein